MINCNCACTLPRVQYNVKIKEAKENGQPLNADNYLNLGYMAGRFGVNLDGNPNEINPIKNTEEGVAININACTAPLFEETLKSEGIKFDRMA